MRIGILETDKPDPEAIEKFGSYVEMFQRLFLSVDDQLEFDVYQVTEGHYPESIHECDAYLITGSKSSVYDEELWIKDLQDYVVSLHDQRKKLVGICFGHQIIAHALGGLTQKSEKGWGVGNTISYIEEDAFLGYKAWIQDGNKTYSLLMSHQDQVVKLPDNATLIASNMHCVHDSFQIDNHILTFQGHPEFSEEYLKYSMDKRRHLIGEEKYNKAMDSLKRSHEGQLVAQWLVKFIKTK